MLWEIETDAIAGAAQAITGHANWNQGGRLGTHTATHHADALTIVAQLQAADCKAWMSPASGNGGVEYALGMLGAYRDAREGIAEAVHAGLEANLGKSAIAARSGLSRPGLDKIIERYGLDRLVKGE